jgi:hypothetical protein
VTATRKTAKPEKSEPKPTAAPKPTTGKSKKKAVTSVKRAAVKTTTAIMMIPNQIFTSPLQGKSYLFNHPHFLARVELTLRLPLSIYTLPIRADRRGMS